MYPGSLTTNIPSENLNLDELLEKEKIKNKSETWNKLDKTMKIRKINNYADKYGETNSFTQKQIKTLKMFLNECLDKNKLNKTKDVHYNKEDGIIEHIPALLFNQTTRNFTLKQCDKRVSTLKSLAPKRVTIKNNNDNIKFRLKEECLMNIDCSINTMNEKIENINSV